MAPPAGTLRVGRYFAALLAIVAVMYLIVFWPGQRHTPKLGLDLEGGTQVILTAKTVDGKTPSKSSMEQAKQIMTDRVNGSGVTEATVVIQGSNQLVISVPKSTETDVAKLATTAKLNFRGLVAPASISACTPLESTTTPAPTASATGSAAPSSPAPSSSAASGPKATSVPTTPASNTAATSPKASSAPASPQAESHSKLAATTSPSPTGSSSASATQTQSPSPTAAAVTPTPAATSTPPAPTCTATPFAELEAAGTKIPTTEEQWDALPAETQAEISTALSMFDCGSAQTQKDDPNSYYVACDPFGQVMLLGPVIVPGTEISSATANAPSAQQGGSLEWSVSIEMKSSGAAAWASYTAAHNTGGVDSTVGVTDCGTSTATPCANFVGITLDGTIISSPVNQAAINGGATQISGSFNQSSAGALANQLKYGALPLTFTPETAQTISASLGSSQLRSGLIAGGIGLLLVIIYSLIYYRLLGLVTIASLIVSAVLIYGSLVILGNQIDFTVSLAGIAGFIVAIGITADSFVVFFERLKDEVHDGRSARVAVPRAWTRARRTIISADIVSFLAAAILYFFAAGDVRGFAFTLGLSTLLDVVVVFLFTHPLVSWLSRFKVFGSRHFTGLDSVRIAGVGAGASGGTIEVSSGSADVEAVQSTADAEALSADERAAARRAKLRAQREEGEL